MVWYCLWTNIEVRLQFSQDLLIIVKHPELTSSFEEKDFILTAVERRMLSSMQQCVANLIQLLNVRNYQIFLKRCSV